MITNHNIIEFRRKFEKIYRNLSSRLDVSRWKSIIASARERDSSSAAAAAVDFIQAHMSLPSVIMKTILRESDLRNCPSEVAEIYGAGVLKEIHEASVKTDVIDYASLPEDITDAQLKEIAGLVEKARTCLDKGQPYMAGKVIDKLNRLCPGNKGVKKLSESLSQVRANGGIPSEVYGTEKANTEKRIDWSRGIRLENNGMLDEAAAFYEKLIAEDFENYEAYCRLGSVYLKLGQMSQAHYIADLLLELGILEGRARVLKGHILETEGRKEDALYYYQTAFMYDRQSKEAFGEIKRILGELDGKGEDLFTDAGVIDQFIVENPEPDPYDLFRLRVNGKTSEVILGADELISKGRLSEAYYELSRASDKYPDSTLLVFKKAYVLYLMRRETEARELLKTIDKEDIMYKRACYLIDDIDERLRDNGAYKDAPNIAQAEILFGAGRYAAALERLDHVNITAMDADTWAFKGRCEIENGRLDLAMESFENAIDRNYHIENVREIMALIYFVKEDYAKAEEMYDHAIKLSKEPEDLCEAKARMYYQLGMKDKLIEFRKSSFALLGHASDVDGYAGVMILNDEPESREAAAYIESALIAGTDKTIFYQAAYKIYMREGLLYRALLCTEAGMALSTEPEQMVYLKACALYKLKKMDSAELGSGMFLAGERKDSRVLYLMGKIQESRGNLSGALKWTLDASVNDPENHEYVFAIAEMYFNREQYSKALVYYSKAISLDGEDYLSFKRRAFIYMKQSNDRKALEDINCALLLRPDDPVLYILMGNIISEYKVEDGQIRRNTGPLSFEKGEDETAAGEKQNTGSLTRGSFGRDFLNDVEKGALYYYSRAVEVAPDYVDAWLWRARYYADRYLMGEALKDADRAQEIAPQSARVYQIRGIIRLMAGRIRDAAADFEKVSLLDPDNAAAFSYASRCSIDLGDYDDAVSKAQKGLDIDNNYVDLYLHRGIAYYYLERYQDAVGDLTIVIMRRNEVAPSVVETAYRYKGKAFEQIGHIIDAVKNYEMLLKFNPRASGIRRRIEELERSQEDDHGRTGLASIFKRKKEDR